MRKTGLIFFLVINHSGLARSEGDIERGLKIGANIVSGGTYLADIEAEKQKIRAEAQLTIERIHAEMASDHRAWLLNFLKEKVARDKLAVGSYERRLANIQTDLRAWSSIKIELIKLIKALGASGKTLEDLMQFNDRVSSLQNLISENLTEGTSKSFETESGNVNTLLQQMIQSVKAQRDANDENQLRQIFGDIVTEVSELQAAVESLQSNLDLLNEQISEYQIKIEALGG